MTSKVAVVTGASRGIGRACSIALAEAGWTVAIGYRSDEAAAKEVLGALEAAGTPGFTVFLDASDEGSVNEAFRRVTEEAGNVTGLVNNAGFSQDGLLLKYSMETYDRVRGLLAAKKSTLLQAAEVLKRRETLEGEELRRLLAGDPIPTGA